MLIEIWERLRGYDQWIETEAKVVGYETWRRRLGKDIKIPQESRSSCSLLAWKDSKGAKCYGGFINAETSPFYQLLDGEKITIRYDPSKPDHYYHRGYFLSRLEFWTKAIAGGLLAGGFLVWRIWRIVTRRGF